MANKEIYKVVDLDDVTSIELEPIQEYCDIEGTGIPKTDLIFDFFWKEELLDRYLEKITWEPINKPYYKNEEFKQQVKECKKLLEFLIAKYSDNYKSYILYLKYINFLVEEAELFTTILVVDKLFFGHSTIGNYN